MPPTACSGIATIAPAVSAERTTSSRATRIRVHDPHVVTAKRQLVQRQRRAATPASVDTSRRPRSASISRPVFRSMPRLPAGRTGGGTRPLPGPPAEAPRSGDRRGPRGAVGGLRRRRLHHLLAELHGRLPGAPPEAPEVAGGVAAAGAAGRIADGCQPRPPIQYPAASPIGSPTNQGDRPMPGPTAARAARSASHGLFGARNNGRHP